jgi:hypothetical protein
MTTVFFGGAEGPTNRNRLLSNGVRNLSFNYHSLYERSKTPNLDTLAGPDADIFLYSGTSSANDNMDKRTDAEWGQYLDDYLATVTENIDRVALATEFAFQGLSLADIQHMREDFWDQLPEDSWAPIWIPDEQLESLAEAYSNVVIPAAALRQSEADDFARVLRTLSRKHEVSFHLMGALQDEWIRRAEPASIITSAWTASTRYGETLLWDSHTIRRIPAEEKDKARRRYKHIIEALGCDADKVRADDPEEVSKLAIMSILAWEERWSQRNVPDTKPVPPPEEKTVSTALAPITKGPIERNVALAEGRAMLPVMQVVQREDETGIHEPEVRSRSSSLRKCDTCPLATYCPAFEVGSDCAYDIPVQIRTKDQLLSVMSTLVEIQGQRALFARFAEELEGGMPTKTTSAELQRFFEMTEKMKAISDDRDFMQVTIQARGNAGVIGRLFGDRSSEAVRALPEPINADEVIAEVLDEEEY